MGKGGESSKTSENAEKKEVLINGSFFDVSKMKHPGGSVINQYYNSGMDATQPFEQFHFRSRKAKKVLRV
jgi:fatty acid desaturase 2 (delta-6 desaturase)